MSLLKIENIIIKIYIKELIHGRAIGGNMVITVEMGLSGTARPELHTVLRNISVDNRTETPFEICTLDLSLREGISVSLRFLLHDVFLVPLVLFFVC